MAKRLNQNITSRYVEAANSLKPRTAPRRIVAYVESYDDVFVWRAILVRYENEHVRFEVMLPSRADHLERGKKAAIMRLLDSRVGRDMIACVDADYDYLMQRANAASRTMLDNPFVLHTYAYAIENLQCYAPSLHGVCVAVTLNDRPAFDFCRFLEQYSLAVFPLFVWNIWHYRMGRQSEFGLTEFLSAIELGKISPANADDTLHRLRQKVDRKVMALQRHYPSARAEYQALKDELKRLGVTPATTYLYIQGHHLMDKVVLPLMKSVCATLVRERENEIEAQSVHDTQCRNELSCYANSISDITMTMKKNVGFVASDVYRRITADVERFLAVDENKTVAEA